jgi:hypothetical protein
MTLLFASLLALTLSMPGWSQTSTGTKNASQTSGDKDNKKDNKKEAKKKKAKSGDKGRPDASKTTGSK